MLALAALFLLAGCASSASYRVGMPCEVKLRDYRSGLTMTIRSESHPSTQRAASNEASKTIKDDLMELLVRRMDEEGFSARARPGGLPGAAFPGSLYGLSLEIPGSSRSLLRNKGSNPEEAAAVVKMTAVFREFYDGAFQAQSVGTPGTKLFDEAQKKLEKEQGKKGGDQL